MENVAMTHLDKLTFVRCTTCRSVLRVLPIAESFADPDGIARQALALADAHASVCCGRPIPRCTAKCQASGCGELCLREHDHGLGHFCTNSHQW